MTLTDWFGFQTLNLLPHFLRAASFVSVSDEVEEERCRILEGWQHIWKVDVSHEKLWEMI